MIYCHFNSLVVNFKILFLKPLQSVMEKKCLCIEKHKAKTHISDLLAEDIDPSVGRFRNMVQTAVIPIKVCFGFVILKYLIHFSVLFVCISS